MSALRLVENEDILGIVEPEKVSEVEMSNIKLAQHMLEQAQVALIRAEGANEFAQMSIKLRYSLGEGDRINEDGTIVRASPQ